jgi:uncharacterized protein DUF1573/HYDIN/CFA65/VesB family protein
MTRAAILLLLAPAAAHAQLKLFVGSTNVTNSTYTLGSIAAGTTGDVVILASNMGSGPVTITKLALAGSGFGIVNTSSTPYPVAPGSSMRIEVQFSAAGGPLGGYNASVQVSTDQGYAVQVILTAISVASATLAVAAPCTGPDSTNTINFGSIAESQTATCTFVLQNNSAQQLTVSAIAVTGAGFMMPQAPATPLNLPVGGSSSFMVTFAPQSAASYSGALTVNTQIFPLAGTAYNPPLPTPMLQFDTNTPQSGQQVTLTMALPTPSPNAVSGSVNLTFQPDGSVSTLANGDPTIMFVASGARSVPFSIQQGSTQATFAGQTGAVFQTGTTTGKITFTVSTNTPLSGDPTTSITLAPVPVAVDNAAATAIAGALNIQVWGFDNTYSAGAMQFTFYDNLGKPIGSGPVTADFSSNFRTYFTTSTDGSAFAMLVSFPINGNAAEVGSVNVQLTNSAGTSTISQLVFRNDTGTCVLIGNILSCPPGPTQ